MEHNFGKHNQVVEALGQKEVFVAVYSISKHETDFLDRIKLCYLNDSHYVKWMSQDQEGTISR